MEISLDDIYSIVPKFGTWNDFLKLLFVFTTYIFAYLQLQLMGSYMLKFQRWQLCIQYKSYVSILYIYF